MRRKPISIGQRFPARWTRLARSRIEADTFRKAIGKYGEANQLIVLFEEMSELQKEICKSFRYNRESLKDHIAEELADVEVMLEQTKMIYGIDEDGEGWRLDKVVRLRERLGMVDKFFSEEGETDDG